MSNYPPQGFNIVEQGETNGVRWFIATSGWYDNRPEKCGNYIPHHGYVELPEGHPFRDIPDHEFGFNDERMSDLEVHGGITYNRDNIWGFDIGHHSDYTPWLGLEGYPISDAFFTQGHRWTLDEVRTETRSLATQIDQTRNAHLYSI